MPVLLDYHKGREMQEFREHLRLTTVFVLIKASLVGFVTSDILYFAKIVSVPIVRLVGQFGFELSDSH